MAPKKKSETLEHDESVRFLKFLQNRGIQIVSTEFIRYRWSKRNLDAMAKNLVKEILKTKQFPLFILLNLSVTDDDQKHANVIVVCPKSALSAGSTLVPASSGKTGRPISATSSRLDPRQTMGGYDLFFLEPNGRYTEGWGETVRHILNAMEIALQNTTIHSLLVERPINTAGGHCDALCLFFIFLVGSAGVPITPAIMRQITDPWFQRFEETTSQTRTKRAGAEARRIVKLIREAISTKSAKSDLVPFPAIQKSK